LELYFKLQNDDYMKGIEKIEMGKAKNKYMHIGLRYKLKKNILNTLIKLGLLENNLILAAFMHRNNLPQQKMRFHGWEQVKLPVSPYLNEKYDILY